ncbi:hypothetical protein [Rhizocola hellebori]|nr:hypothetical protein [Rhizocola hellebori]
MRILVWLLALALVGSGLVLTTRRRMFWGISLVLFGMLAGIAAASTAA